MDLQAERRRQALTKFMKAHKLSRGALARKADLSPNIVYNFMAGRSGYLSQPTLEKIAQALGVPITAITGDKSFEINQPVVATGLDETSSSFAAPETFGLPSGFSTLSIRGIAMGSGVWSDSIFVAPEREEHVSFTLPSLYAGKAFAVKVRASASGGLIPQDAILACAKVHDYLQALADGDIVIMVRQNPLGLFETTVRRYRIEGKRHFLILPGNDQQAIETLELKSPLRDPAATGFQDFFIHSIVLAYVASLPAARR
jgi:transcriptional regulator with XRE-family HTH domain